MGIPCQTNCPTATECLSLVAILHASYRLHTYEMTVRPPVFMSVGYTCFIVGPIPSQFWDSMMLGQLCGSALVLGKNSANAIPILGCCWTNS